VLCSLRTSKNVVTVAELNFSSCLRRAIILCGHNGSINDLNIGFDLLLFAGPFGNRASGFLKLDSSGGSHYLARRVLNSVTSRVVESIVVLDFLLRIGQQQKPVHIQVLIT
jgi:hypothetical protein